jgi:hypothetical protein
MSSRTIWLLNPVDKLNRHCVAVDKESCAFESIYRHKFKAIMMNVFLITRGPTVAISPFFVVPQDD